MADQQDQAADTRAAHVRSFAKDMALAKGKKPQDMRPIVAPPPKVQPPPVIPVQPKPIVPPVVPAQPKAVEPVSAQPKPVEPVVPAPPPKPVPPAPPPGITPLPPLPPVEPKPIPPPPTDKERDEILARLRAKVLASKEGPKETPTPAVVPPIALVKPDAPKAAPIHTYKSDFAEHIDEQNASVFSVLAAEKDADAAPPTTLADQKKGRTMFIVGGMFILLGIVGVYVAYRWSHDLSVNPIADTVPSLVFADSRKEIYGTGPELLAALTNAANEPLPPGNVLITYVTSATTTGNGDIVSFPAPGGVLFQKLQLPAPDILLRNVLEESTVGAIHAGEETRAFFILRVSSYERTFAGMLDWEKKMQGDLGLLYPSYAEEVAPVATTTASSTPPVAVPPPPKFVDDVVASRNVRALRDYKNRTLLLYGYRDKETLIIARDEDAFTQLVERLAATR